MIRPDLVPALVSFLEIVVVHVRALGLVSPKTVVFLGVGVTVTVSSASSSVASTVVVTSSVNVVTTLGEPAMSSSVVMVITTSSLVSVLSNTTVTLGLMPSSEVFEGPAARMLPARSCTEPASATTGVESGACSGTVR